MTNHDPTTVTKTAVAESVVTREANGEEQDMLRIPISSTRPDREGDRFTKEALEDMADQIKVENPMVFDNHGLAGNWMEAIPYDSRETIGAQMDAEVEVAEDSEADLYALVNPDGTHPEGERLLGQVRDEGQPIKFSVGFRVLDYDAIEDDAGNEIGREFTRSDLMETSRVGIPANPDASVTQSMTAKGAGESLPGYANHPMMQMLAAMRGGETPEAMTAKDAVNSDTVEDATPVRVDGGEKDADPEGEDAETTLRESVESLRAEVAELRDVVKEDDDDDDDDDDDEDGDKDACDVDTDCPEGEVCLEGECVPEEEVDDDDEEESSADVPESVKELREANKALRDEVSEVRKMLSEGRGDSETGDTAMADTTPEVEEADDADEDETTDKNARNGLLFD